jgi:hypothetical protein
MAQKIRRTAAAWLAACLLSPTLGQSQSADFKIAWSTIGEMVSSAEKEAAPVQRGTKIARVEVQPTIVEIAVGEQVCIASLRVRTLDADGRPVAGVPLSISVREDHKQPLQLTRSKGICVRPARSGEYPIRLSSKVPAADDTLRGAQIFVRAR